MVAELRQESFDPILIFKPQGRKDAALISNLQEDAFVLVLPTEFQMELHRNYASKIVCIDSTHGTNQY